MASDITIIIFSMEPRNQFSDESVVLLFASPARVRLVSKFDHATRAGRVVFASPNVRRYLLGFSIVEQSESVVTRFDFAKRSIHNPKCTRAKNVIRMIHH